MRLSSRGFIAVLLTIVLVFSFTSVALARGGGGFSSGGGRSFSSSSFSSSGRSVSSSSRSFSSSSKSFSSSSRSYSPGFKSTTRPSDMTGFKTYTSPAGKTIYYMPRTYTYTPRPYYSPFYGQPVYGYYVNNTGSDFWFWMWLMGRNEHGMDAPKYAVMTTATADNGEPAGYQTKAVNIPDNSVWNKYDASAKTAVALTWLSIIAGVLGFFWLAVAAVRAFTGYQHPFRFWMPNSYDFN